MATQDRFEIARHWDAGDVGCGEFIVGVKRELNHVEPGELLRLTTGNAGAPADLPAWCRMTGHTLIFARHPVYVIERNTTPLRIETKHHPRRKQCLQKRNL